MMDDFERRVLRQRKSTFAQSVTVDKEFLTTVKRANLINEDMVQVVKSEKNDESRASIFVDYLMSSPLGNAFDVFTSVLMNDYAWLAKELQADVKAERGNLEIDDDVMKEAGMLVHRKFGTSKRIAEMDKKDMQELIAVKIQISKEEWREEIDALKKEIKHLEKLITKEGDKARDVVSYLEKFTKENSKKLVSRAHGMKSTTDTLLTSDNDDDPVAILNSRIVWMTSRAKLVMDERDLLYDDREKCYKAVGMKEENGRPLHEVLRSREADYPNEVRRWQEEAEEKDKVVKRLRKLLAEYETELEGNESKVKGIKDDLADRTMENLDLKKQIKQMERDMDEFKSKVEAKTVKKVRRTSVTNGKK